MLASAAAVAACAAEEMTLAGDPVANLYIGYPGTNLDRKSVV